jgi:hypothetical protein
MNLIVRTQNTDNELYSSLSKCLWLQDLNIIFKNSFKPLNNKGVCVCQLDVMTFGVNLVEKLYTEVNQMLKIIHNNFVNLEQTS